MRARPRMQGRQRAREIPALLFALVWLLGYEALPLAHTALHAQLSPHSHGASAAHCHDGACHDESAASDEEHGSTAPADPVSHGENSLEHRGLAALAPSLTIYVAQLTLIGELSDTLAPEARSEVFVLNRPFSRGPPA